jgi:hypothetical protein
LTASQFARRVRSMNICDGRFEDIEAHWANLPNSIA